MKLSINTIPCSDIDIIYEDGMSKLFCDGCDTEILESENVFVITYRPYAEGCMIVYHTHNSQDCLKPWINNTLQR